MTVKALATNRSVLLIRPYPYNKLWRYWSFIVPGWYFIRKRYAYWDKESGEIKYRWDGRKSFLKDDRVPAGLFRATRKDIKNELGIKFKVKAKVDDVLRCTDSGASTSTRAYQNDCVDAMLSRISRGGGLILNATGSGKTRIAGMFSGAISGRVCFLVDQLDLLEQARNELETTLGEKVGYVGNSVYKPERITVATVQTVHRHIGDHKFRRWFRSIDILIIDEIHVQMSKRNFKSVEIIQPKAVFGLTATLELKKKDVRMQAFAICGPVCYEYPLVRGMQEGVLSRGVVTRILYENPLDEED